MERTYLYFIYVFLVLVLSSCGGGDETPNPTSTEISNPTPADTQPTPIAGPTFTVELSCVTANEAGMPEGVLDGDCTDDSIQIPNDRPIYALLVSGYYQNSNLDMFHWYRFAQSLHEKGAYVHYAWWNNLLAPYMERPLHNTESTPGYYPDPKHDREGFIFGESYPNKALPAEDYQFQKDAEKFLKAISEEEPDAAIILVGHSMGGGAIARLAENIDINIKIALLAPIDPVGNRTCLPCYANKETQCIPPFKLKLSKYVCDGGANFKRWYAIRKDHFVEAPFPLPFVETKHRELRDNIEYLYHRWQTEWFPPWDYWPANQQWFNFHDNSDYVNTIFEGSTNVQSRVSTSIWSGYAARSDNAGGGIDGHGEIVGFSGVWGLESDPLGLAAQGNWPSRDQELNFENENDPDRLRRVELMKLWDADPYYLERPHGETVPYAPKNPELCMVSSDLSTILNTVIAQASVNSSPVANAGPDQVVECTDPGETKVFLNGSGSTDPDGTIDRFDWKWTGDSATGEEIVAYLPLGTHMFTLTVTDNGGLTDTDMVDVTVQDTTAPTLSVTLSPNVLLPSNHKMVSITATIQFNDSCDDSPIIKLVSITSNEADNGMGDGDTSNDIQGAEFGTDDREFLLRAERSGHGTDRIYTVTYEVTDASGNVTVATAEVTVPHDHGKSK